MYSVMIRLALYQPDIPQNTGAAIRLCACLGAALDIIEPCGFIWDDRKIRRSAMDYGAGTDIVRHRSWDDFYRTYQNKNRILLMTTKGKTLYTDHDFRTGDIILMGRESAGIPDDIAARADARLVIPMAGNARSFNVINAAAMTLGEAQRQIRLK